MKRFLRYMGMLQEFTLLVRDVLRSGTMVFRYLNETVEEMYLIGAQSFPLVAIGGLFMGIILSLEMGYRFESFGAKTLVGRTVVLGMIRELGPVVSGLLLAGRVGAKNASELGSMKLSEQIDALRAFGSNPIHTLVLPRTVACVIMFLPLILVADAAGMLGGVFVAQTSLHLDPSVFWQTGLDGLKMRDLIVGFTKPIAFGFFIATISCYYGLRTTGGTVGLGRSTIDAVVASSLVVLLLDFIFTKVVWEIM
jgi:phospholipid/cholesterol/gamma-HCH transport system permease protein